MEFRNLLIRTAFSSMACDGKIGVKELELVKGFILRDGLCEPDALVSELNDLVQEFNADGVHFLETYLSMLRSASLSEEEQIKVLRYAIEIVKADEVVDYSEIKFCKTIRACLSVNNERIISSLGDVSEFLERDISSRSYLESIKNNLASMERLPKISVAEIEDDDS